MSKQVEEVPKKGYIQSLWRWIWGKITQNKNEFRKPKETKRHFIEGACRVVGMISAGFVPTALAEGNLAFLLWMLLFVVAGVFAPFAAGLFLRNESHPLDYMRRFTSAVPGFIQPISDYIQSDMLGHHKDALLNDLVACTSSALSDDARICVYKYELMEEDEEDEDRRDRFKRIKSHGRPGDAREYFDRNTDEGRALLEAVVGERQIIVVENVEARHRDLAAIKPNKHSGYRSFVVIPIESAPVGDEQERRLRGLITIDYPENRKFYNYDREIYLGIAKAFEVGFATIRKGGQDTQDVMSDIYRQIQSRLAVEGVDRNGGGSHE